MPNSPLISNLYTSCPISQIQFNFSVFVVEIKIFFFCKLCCNSSFSLVSWTSTIFKCAQYIKLGRNLCSCFLCIAFHFTAQAFCYLLVSVRHQLSYQVTCIHKLRFKSHSANQQIDCQWFPCFLLNGAEINLNSRRKYLICFST